MRFVGADHARATIAAHILGTSLDDRLGEITLHAHQLVAVGRLKTMLTSNGGALLADDVGLGKTYAALGVAQGVRSVVVIAPAAVRDHWARCAARAAVAIAFHSMESLSRRGAPEAAPDLVIIDEAHHFRTTTTRRFASARRLCARARVLLLSATPVQNRAADLRAVLSLFLGSRARALSNADLARFVVRRGAEDLGGSDARLPSIGVPRWLAGIDDVDCLDRILALPAALPPVDGNDGGALVTFTLLRQWASSRAALRTALRRRLARGLAMIDAMRVGRIPSRAELTSWCHAENAQQLFFPELVHAAIGSGAARLLAQVEGHVQGLRALLDWLAASPDPDAERARSLLGLLQRHRGERLIAFSEYAETVHALFRLVLPSAPVAVLAHGGGRVASGPIRRADILDRFSAGSASRAHRRDRIDLLLTTDMLSEGVGLPDASVVVHLDLAWNPARMEQRVGRLRRVDSTHRSIAVYLMPPPASAERMLRVERRLRAKRSIARLTLGVAGAVLPGDDGSAAVPGAVGAGERVASLLRPWRGGGGADDGVVAAARAPQDAAIACVRGQGGATLLAVTDADVSDDLVAVERLCAIAGGDDAAIDDHLVRVTRERVERFLTARQVSQIVDPAALQVARARRALLHRAGAIARCASRELRTRIAPQLHAVRAVASAPLSAEAERALGELAEADVSDDAWLRAITEFGALHANAPSAARPAILALLILRAG